MVMKYALAIAVLAGVMVVSSVQAAQPSLEDFYRTAPAPVQYVPPTVPDTDAPAAPAAGSHVVTSVSKCFEDLGPDESAEIKRNSLTPYADCQKRLRERALEKKAQPQEPVAETPRNYRRVVETPQDESEVQAPAAAPAKKK